MRFIRYFAFTLLTVLIMSLAYKHVSAGNLYIKPELELRRAARLLDEADTDFRNGKIHMSLSPEISLLEFEHSKTKYSQAVEIIEIYGRGNYTPGDVEDFRARMVECDLWIKKSRDSLPKEKN